MGAFPHEDFCLGWFIAIAINGGLLLFFYTWQFFSTTLPLSRKTPLKRILQVCGSLGAVLFLLAWLEPSGECADLFEGNTYDVIGQFSSDGLSSLFVIEYILTTSTFLHAVALVTGSSKACVPVLQFFSVGTVLCWLTVDSVVVYLDRQYPRAIFYWWLMLALWVAFVHCCAVAMNLSRVILGPDEVDSRTTPRADISDQTTILLLGQRAARARKILKDLIYLLVCTSLILGLATWMWVTDGIRVWSDRETRGSPPITQRLLAHAVFCGCHAFGLWALLWFIWLPPGRLRCPQTQTAAPQRQEESMSSTATLSDSGPSSDGRREPSQHQKKFAEERRLEPIEESDPSDIDEG